LSTKIAFIALPSV